MSLNTIWSNPIMLTDCYNLSHQRLKCNVDWEVSHIYNRNSGMVLYGFAEMVEKIFSIQITMTMVDEAQKWATKMGLSFPRDLWMRVIKECGGYIPLKIQSMPEGSWCPKGTPFAQVRNTVEGFGEMVTWLEAPMLHVAFASACATRAMDMRLYLEEKRKQYGFDESFLWRFHSFGFRGCHSMEDAYWSGTAWNLFLKGTDDFHTARHTPGAEIGSIAALAHKVVQQWDDEFQCFEHAINSTADAGEKIVALVIDTWNSERVIDYYLPGLSALAVKRGIKIVMRPDSGDVWSQGYHIYRACQLHDLKNVGCIIGEGMSFEVAKEYDRRYENHGCDLSFFNYGIGAGYYKDLERDTCGWAMKTAYSNGAPRMKLADGVKTSIPDKVQLCYRDTDVVKDECSLFVEKEKDSSAMYNIYETVYMWGGKDRFDRCLTIPLWNGIYCEAQDTLDFALNGELQKDILISPEILDEVREFKLKYRL